MLTGLLKLFIKSFVCFWGIVPHRICLCVGKKVGELAYFLMSKRAQVARENLKLIYGDKKSSKEIKKMAKNNFSHLGEIIWETLKVVGRPSSIKNFFKLAGQENLSRAIAQGKGIVFFSAHLGNFIILAAVLSKLVGMKILFRKPSQALISEIYAWLFKRLGILGLADNPRHICAYHAHTQLNQKGGLLVLIDQVETGGLYINFMGQPAGATLGAANMVIKSKSILMPVFCVRLPNKHLKVTIGKEIKIKSLESQEELVKAIVVATNQEVENWVYRYPEQWFWGHRRWRKWKK